MIGVTLQQKVIVKQWIRYNQCLLLKETSQLIQLMVDKDERRKVKDKMLN
jgi:hypothetical protein